MTKSKILLNEPALLQLASFFANFILPGTNIFLQGELGSGKTTFARGFLRGLKFLGSVKSPTYTLVEEYNFSWGKLYHFDLYRLSHPEELDFIGIREYFAPNTIVLVEWPEKGKEALPDPDLSIKFLSIKNGRELKIVAKTPLGNDILAQIEI